MSSSGTSNPHDAHADDRITIQKRSKQGNGCTFVTVHTRPQNHATGGMPVMFSEDRRKPNMQAYIRKMHGQVLMVIAEACMEHKALTTAFTALECIRLSDDAAPVVNKLALMSPYGITPDAFMTILIGAIESSVPGFAGVFDLVSSENKFAKKDNESKDAPDAATTSSLSVYLVHNDINQFLCTLSEFPNLDDVFSCGLSIQDITWALPLSIKGKQYDLLQLLPPLLVRSLRDHGSSRIASHLEAILEASSAKSWRGKTLPTEAIARLEKAIPDHGASADNAIVLQRLMGSLSQTSGCIWPLLTSFADELIQLPYLPPFSVAFPQEWDGFALNNLHQYARFIIASNPGMTGWQAYCHSSMSSMSMRAGLWQLLLLPYLALHTDVYHPMMM